MANSYRKYSTARKHAAGLPIVRVSDLYIVGVDGVDEVTIFGPTGGSTAHITLRHLDRLGNGNYAIETQPTPSSAYDKPTRDVIGLAMGQPEAMALWTLLDRVLAGQDVSVDVEEHGEKLRWTRDRLARVVSDKVEAITP